jgi:hypothetical protein
MLCRVVRYRAPPRRKKSLAAIRPRGFQTQDRHEQNRQRQGQELSRASCTPREGPCNIHLHSAAISVWRAWNGRGTRSARRLFLFQVRESCNDSRSRSTKRSQPQRSYNVPLLSHRFNRRASAIAQMFSSGSRNGATGPELTVSDGTPSVGAGTTAGLASTEGCLIRVAMSIAVNSIAAAR